MADLTQDRVNEFPGFDRGEFKKLTEDELKMMDDQMFGVCCIDATIDIALAVAATSTPTTGIRAGGMRELRASRSGGYAGREKLSARKRYRYAAEVTIRTLPHRPTRRREVFRRPTDICVIFFRCNFPGGSSCWSCAFTCAGCFR